MGDDETVAREYRLVKTRLGQVEVSEEIYRWIVYGSEKGISMRPSIDHYVGYPIEEITHVGDAPWQWAIRLEGGILLKNHDESRTLVPSQEEVAGKQILTVEMNTQSTVLKIGHLEGEGENKHPVYDFDIPFAPLLYSIADARYSHLGEEIFPQRNDHDQEVPHDPSPERTVDAADEPVVLSEESDGEN